MSQPEENKYALYLQDLGGLVKEYALEAKADFNNSKGSDSEEFKSGYLMGYHRFITLMQQQAVAFNIPLEDIGLQDIDENDLF